MSSFFASLFERHWQAPNILLFFLLWPWSRLFAFITAVRRDLYRRGILPSAAAERPVVIIGNIRVGGVGKTPLVDLISTAWTKRGRRIGVISRGYGRLSRETLLVPQDPWQAHWHDYGDEPLLLARHLPQLPIAVGRQRVAAASKLIAAHPELEYILSDDGLQHFALRRTAEVVVVPAMDVVQSDFLDVLPNGPLRESWQRLREVQAVIVQHDGIEPTHTALLTQRLHVLQPQLFVAHASSRLLGFYRWGDKRQAFIQADELPQKDLIACCAIARPQRFFQSLHNLGVYPRACLSFADHAAIPAAHLPPHQALIISEKDAVKWQNDFSHAPVYVLAYRAWMSAEMTARLIDFLEECLRSNEPH